MGSTPDASHVVVHAREDLGSDGKARTKLDAERWLGDVCTCITELERINGFFNEGLDGIVDRIEGSQIEGIEVASMEGIITFLHSKNEDAKAFLDRLKGYLDIP